MANTPFAAAEMTTVRLPRDLVERVRALAVEHDRSLSAELRHALRLYVQAEGNSR